jgi:gamma-glutamylcyclotransferase (GGCT)/AIG2-like uncharacterized protein YtfP
LYHTEFYARNDSMILNRLFVYGTLRLGSSNEHADRLRETARYLGAARIRGQLFRVLHYPALGPPQLEQDWVLGDLFEAITDDLMQQLDDYEGAEYTRHVAEVMLDDGGKLAAYVYLYALPTAGLTRIESGVWEAVGS